MSQEEIYINGELLRLRRETRGWALSDLATLACMSVKQIRQLEEGGLSSFYSQAVKLTAAKKVGALLGVSAEEVFAKESEAEVVALASGSDQLAHDEEPASVEVETAPVIESKAGPTEESVVDVTTIHAEPKENEKNEVEPDAPVKSKTSLWVISGLFAAALGVAAYMQPKEEPLAEPEPPLQVVPSEADAAASAAEASASSASAAASAESVAAPVTQKAAIASAPSSSAPMMGTASTSRIAASASVPAASPAKLVTAPAVAPVTSTSSAVKTP
jgi:cytoskeleton protein RodZ